MYLAYVDDSGDETRDLLSAVLLPLGDWRQCLRVWLDWRRFLFRAYGVPADFELHAIEFLRPAKNPIPTNHSRAHKVHDSRINEVRGVRREVYRRSLEALGFVPGLRVVTVCLPGNDRVATYQALITALETTMSDLDRDVVIMVDGTQPDPRLRGEHRQLKLKHRRVLEDPWHERSKHSQLLQIADLVVHAAYQHVIRNPNRQFMWDWYPEQLGASIRVDLDDGACCGIDSH